MTYISSMRSFAELFWKYKHGHQFQCTLLTWYTYSVHLVLHYETVSSKIVNPVLIINDFHFLGHRTNLTVMLITFDFLTPRNYCTTDQCSTKWKNKAAWCLIAQTLICSLDWNGSRFVQYHWKQKHYLKEVSNYPTNAWKWSAVIHVYDRAGWQSGKVAAF